MTKTIQEHHANDATPGISPLVRVDEICDAFEAAWHSGRGPRIEDYFVDGHDAYGDELFQELLLSEWELRERAGETIEIEGYLKRFGDHEQRINILYRQTRTAEGTSTDDKGRDNGRRTFGPTGLSIRCPTCHQLIHLAADSSFSEVTCPNCDSRFNLTDIGSSTAKGTRFGTIGHFELVERLGVGAFGSVWKARDTQLDRMVAVKIPRNGGLEPDEIDRFLREARIAAQLRHPNIVSVHEVGCDGDTVYIVSDIIRGASLREWLTGQQVTARESAELCVKLADALHHAHQAGVVHRDLKPQNIMLDSAREPYLMDFGLARRDGGEITMTMDGQLLGTPAYMAPEQARGEGHHADRRTDIYSLGVILFELLTGELPFRGNARMVIQQVLHDEPPAPRRLSSAVPRDLENITLKCLEKEAQRRYSTAREFSEDLRRYVDGKPVLARPISYAARTARWCKRRPTIAFLTACVSTLLLVLMIGGPLMAIRQSRLAEDYRRSLYLSDLQSAADALDTGDWRRAVDLLERAPPDLRTVEWHLLWKKCRPGSTAIDLGRQLNSPTPLGKLTRRLVYSSKGDLAAAHNDGTLTIWRDKALLQQLVGHVGQAQSIAFSEDGELLASGGDDGIVNIWDVETGTLEQQIKTGRSNWSLAFLASDVVIAQTVDGIGRWNARTGQCLGAVPNAGMNLVYPHEPHGNGRFTISHDCTLMALSDSRGITITNLHTHETNGPWRAHKTHPWCLAFSNDDRYLITGGGDDDPTVKVWGVQTQAPVCNLRGHTKRIRAVRMSPTDDDLVASVSWDKKVKLWSISRATEVATLIGHSAHLFAMDFAPDGRTLASAGEDGTIKVWDLSSLKKERLLGHESMPTSLAFHPDGTLASAGRDGIVFWDSHTGRMAKRGYRPSDLGQWNDVAFSPDGLVYATFANPSSVVLVDYATQKEQRRLRHAPETNLNCLAYSPSGEILATGAWNGDITLWNVNSSSPPHSICFGAHRQEGVDATDLDNFWGQPHMVHDLVFIDEETLVSIGANQTLRVWRITSDEHETPLATGMKTFPLHQYFPRAMAVSTNGDLLAVAGEFGYLSLWRTNPFEPLATWFSNSPSGILSLAFAPSDDTLISGGFDGDLRFWDTQTQTLRMTTADKVMVSAIAVSSDGGKIAWAGEDGVVRLLRTR